MPEKPGGRSGTPAVIALVVGAAGLAPEATALALRSRDGRRPAGRVDATT